MTTKTLTRIFPSVKVTSPNPNTSSKLSLKSSTTIRANSASSRKSTSSGGGRGNRWSVYLILSTSDPIRTYVGVTTDFNRRLRQHNGELKGGAKAARAERPWICACS